jgi:hypothetical protein
VLDVSNKAAPRFLGAYDAPTCSDGLAVYAVVTGSFATGDKRTASRSGIHSPTWRRRTTPASCRWRTAACASSPS